MEPTAGLGFKPAHLDDALARHPAGQWFEVHAENYMLAGGPRLAMLSDIRARYPVSVHGVGLSLAADHEPDPVHLQRLCNVVRRTEPFLISEHLAWSSFDGSSLPDLLPFPRTLAALRRISDNIDIVQSALGRRILVENPSLYAQLPGHEFSEPEFLTELSRRTGCGLLIDVNNIYVGSHNLEFDPLSYLGALPAAAIGEVHLAGHSLDPSAGLLIDSHDAPIADPVWRLYERLIERIGPRPTLIERDDNVPAFSALMSERDRAHRILLNARETMRVFMELAANA